MKFDPAYKVISLCLLSGVIAGCVNASEAPVAADKKQDQTVLEKTSDVSGIANPQIWPEIAPLQLDADVEARVDVLLSKMTLEQKVGQIIQGDSDSITPEEVKKYRLGSILSGGSSAPGDRAYADAKTWLETADEYYDASLDPEGVEVAIPLIWGIDAVHGHTNLYGAVVFPHNIGLGAANNPDLIEAIAASTAKALTVSGHDWTFAPTLAVPRDTRWGRTYEGFSYSPEIAAEYSARIVEGLQGVYGDEGFMKEGRVISSAKHFLGDGGTENGMDQGDAKISEEELRDIHGAGYIGAVESGVQTVMASFSSWHGKKMHGHKSLLTGVLKEQMNFQGFIVGDWNGHGQVAGCTNTDCPQAINAGLDMFMAPDSWKGLYETTLAHAKSGVISQERLDDAVRRILRVKVASGIFEKGRPSERANAGDAAQLGADEHRSIARQAVRESLVLLKNNDQTLPLSSSQTVMVIGDGADSLSKASGGWTLSWQGTGHSNDEFPNGTSILDGIKSVVEADGGKVIFNPTGEVTDTKADVVIAVFGEDPYAEFQGDAEHLAFVDNGFETANLAAHKAAGSKVVSVFLSGRPLWTNNHINSSDAFVAAWLPGSEGAGVSDMLFRTSEDYDFTGRLSYPWPATADAEKALTEDPLFKLGYGLGYGDEATIDALSKGAGISLGQQGERGQLFVKGQTVQPWSLVAASSDGTTTRISATGLKTELLNVSKVDFAAQEDALALEWTQADSQISVGFETSEAVNYLRESNGAMEMAFNVRSLTSENAIVSILAGCETGTCEVVSTVVAPADDWKDVRVSLSCFAEKGLDMENLNAIMALNTASPSKIGLANVRLEADLDGVQTCPAE